MDVGSWFKKQNSARHYVPIVSIVSIKSHSSDGSVVLRFTNPGSAHLSSVTSDVNITCRLPSDSEVATVEVNLC